MGHEGRNLVGNSGLVSTAPVRSKEGAAPDAAQRGASGRRAPLLSRLLVPALLLSSLTGCSTVSSIGSDFFGGSPSEGAPGHVTGFLGGVVADEPRAALVAREV